jgi:hypothetical protein
LEDPLLGGINGKYPSIRTDRVPLDSPLDIAIRNQKNPPRLLKKKPRKSEILRKFEFKIMKSGRDISS